MCRQARGRSQSGAESKPSRSAIASKIYWKRFRTATSASRQTQWTSHKTSASEHKRPAAMPHSIWTRRIKSRVERMFLSIEAKFLRFRRVKDAAFDSACVYVIVSGSKLRIRYHHANLATHGQLSPMTNESVNQSRANPEPMSTH